MSRLQSFSAGQSRPVDPAKIESELTALWKNAASGTDEDTNAVTRTCLANLIHWSTRSDGKGALPDRIAEVVSRHPSRVILMQIDPGTQKSRLEAQVSAHCTLPSEGRRQVYCEQITLQADALTLKHLPGLAAALSTADVPAFLVVEELAEIERPELVKLAGTCDFIVVDTGQADAVMINKVATLSSRLEKCSLVDLNWRRLRPYQDMIAAFFDGPAFRPAIHRLERFDVGGAPGTSGTALLLAGWVRAVLEERQIRFRFREDDKAGDGMLSRAVLSTEAPDPVSFAVNVDAVEAVLVGTVTRKGTCPLPNRKPLALPPSWQILCGVMERAASNPLLEKSLKMAAAMVAV
jgi:glucose-6-phosphate dehydrogenase assembly protein OpcA